MCNKSSYIKRDRTLDMMKGLGIVAVIIGHLTSYGRQFIFSFHMPMFFIIAGFLYRRKIIPTSVKNDFKRLIIPYLVTAVFIVVFYFILEQVTGKEYFYRWLKAALWGSSSPGHQSPLFGDYPSIGAIWFLLAMFWCKLFFLLIDILCKNKNHIVLVSLILSITACEVDEHIINLPFVILPGISALVFFVTGFLLQQYNILDKIRNSEYNINYQLVEVVSYCLYGY